MRSHGCVLALIATVIWLALSSGRVAGETRIELDENGDEYELKRFYIQGRQLTGQGSKSQCVVTRRKRASRGLSLAQSGVSVSSQPMSFSAVPSIEEAEQESGRRRYVVAAVQLQQEDDDEDDDDEDLEDEDDEEMDDDGADDQQLQLQMQQLVLGADEQMQPLPQQQQQQQQQQQPQQQPQPQQPLANPLVVEPVQQKQFATSQNPSSFVAATYTQTVPGSVSVVANAATHANVGGDAGIVVVESQEPPKVNPNTHAVFELKPLSQQSYYQEQSLGYPDEGDNDDGDDGFYYQGLGVYDDYEHFVTEDSPVSTSAIWSTDGDDDDIRPVVNEANRPVQQKKKKRKQQNRRKQQQQQQQQQRLKNKKKKRPATELNEANAEQDIKRKKQPQQQLQLQLQQQTQEQEQGQGQGQQGVASGSAGMPKPAKKPGASPVKRRKNKPNSQQKNKKRKSRPNSAGNRRRRPSSAANYGGYNRRRPQLTEAQRRRRLQQKRRRQQQQQQQQRQRRRRNKNRQQNGGGGYRRPYFGDEPIVNCIYINKDPPTTTTTTTPRPFWNLLGRDAALQSEATPQRNGEFGHRKRATLKFTA